MARRTRGLSIFSISILDLLCCAFAAVVLLAILVAAMRGNTRDAGQLRVFAVSVRSPDHATVSVWLTHEKRSWLVSRGTAPPNIRAIPEVVGGRIFGIIVEADRILPDDRLCVFLHDLRGDVPPVSVQVSRRGRGIGDAPISLTLSRAAPAVAIGMDPFLRRPAPCG